MEEKSSAQAGTMANVHGLGAVAQATHKVSLERYRSASRRIFSVFTDIVGEHSVEKASIDEAFLDVTSLVDSALASPEAAPQMLAAHSAFDALVAVQGGAHARHPGVGQDPPAQAPPHGSVPGTAAGNLQCWLPPPRPLTGGGGPQNPPPPLHDWCVAWPVGEGEPAPPPAGTLLPPGDPLSTRLLLAAHVAATCRREVWRRLGFTCSAGVAHNKLLAKLASARNKPNQQTLVPVGTVRPLLARLPLGSLRHLGGKLGERVAKQWRVSTVGELLGVSFEDMLRVLGEKTGPWLWGVVRGQCAEEVRVGRTATKSMLAAKSFRAAQGQDMAAVATWMRMLASDLAARMVADAAQHGRAPRTLSVCWCRADVRGQAMRSKTGPMPPRTRVTACEVDAWRREQSRGGGGVADTGVPTAPPGEKPVTATKKGHGASDCADGGGDSDASTDVDDAVASEAGAPTDPAAVFQAGVNSAETEDSRSEHALAHSATADSSPGRRLARRVRLLEGAALALLGGVPPSDIVPCTRLALAAGSFSETAVAQGQKRLRQFFEVEGGAAPKRAAGAAEATAAPAPAPAPAAAAAATDLAAMGLHTCNQETVFSLETDDAPRLLESVQHGGQGGGGSGSAGGRGKLRPPPRQSAPEEVNRQASCRWHCTACTLVNDATARLCSACGAWAPRLKAAGGGLGSGEGNRPTQPSLGRWLGKAGAVGNAARFGAVPSKRPARTGGIARFFGGGAPGGHSA